MSYNRHSVDISDEFILNRFGNGVKLFKPNTQTTQQDENAMVGNIMMLPMAIGFHLPKCTTVLPNDNLAQLVGFDAITDMIDTTPLEYYKKCSAFQILNQHENVSKENNIRLVEQHVALTKKERPLHAITLILPWYGNNAMKVNGTLSFTIALGIHSLSDSFSTLFSLGLLNSQGPCSHMNASFKYSNMNNLHFSKREKECIDLVMAGKKYKEIANILSLSQRTVEHYIQNIKAKFDAPTKAELILKIKQS